MPDIAHVYPFKSKSNPDNNYKCTLYVDGTTSCNCPGWTRRVPAGGRECKHTMMVDELRKGGQVALAPRAPVAKAKPAQTQARKFDFTID